jgi:FMN phosphatase YigB (HAD superfamily)
MDLSKIKVVSWDLDGTLYSLPEMKKHFRIMVIKEILKLSVKSIGDFYHLWKFHKSIGRYRDGRKIDLSSNEIESFEKNSSVWYGECIKKTGSYPGVNEIIRHFTDKKQVILSDYEVKGKIESLFLEPFWIKSYSCMEMGYLKPSSFGLKKILDDFDILPSELLHIGDKDHYDGVAARAAGCEVLILKKDFKDYKELLNILERPCI